MNVTIAASALNAPSHSARHRTKSTPGSGQNASASYVKLCRLRFTRGFHSRMSSSYARFPRASCTCDVYTTSSSTSDGSTSNNARLSFSRSALVVRSCALKPVCSDSASHVALGSSSAEATRARRRRGTGRERAPVPKPPRERRGRGAPGAIARGAAARWGIAGGVLGASGLLKAPRATPICPAIETQPTTFSAPRKLPAQYARAKRCVAANARFSAIRAGSTDARVLLKLAARVRRHASSAFSKSRLGDKTGKKIRCRWRERLVAMRSHDTFSAFSARTRVFCGAAREPRTSFHPVRHDSIRCARHNHLRVSLPSFGSTRATAKKAPLSPRPSARARPQLSSRRQAFSLCFLARVRLYLGVGKMGVKFSGTDHLSLGRYWYTPAAMCERRRCGWFM